MKKKGFTLIELLAVIVILAIIATFVIQVEQGKAPTFTTKLPELTDDKISEYKQEFNEIFENKVFIPGTT